MLRLIKKVIYIRARYYNPLIGRFTQEDTHWNTTNAIYGDNPQKINAREDKLGLKTYSYATEISAVMQSGNLYVYCTSNPITYYDTTGNKKESNKVHKAEEESKKNGNKKYKYTTCLSGADYQVACNWKIFDITLLGILLGFATPILSCLEGAELAALIAGEEICVAVADLSIANKSARISKEIICTEVEVIDEMAAKVKETVYIYDQDGKLIEDKCYQATYYSTRGGIQGYSKKPLYKKKNK